MQGVIEKQLALAIDKRIAVFKGSIQSGSILQKQEQLQMVVYLIGEIIRPCCCMFCSKEKLRNVLEQTSTCAGQEEVIAALAERIHLDLARCNGLG